MGAWGAGAFDNDSAVDFSYQFEKLDREGGLDLIAGAIDDVLAEEEYLDSDFAVMALVACEAISRLAGQGGKQSPYSETLDRWVTRYPGPVDEAVVQRGLAAIMRILGEDSELSELWEDSPKWLAEMDDLKRRVAAAAP